MAESNEMLLRAQIATFQAMAANAAIKAKSVIVNGDYNIHLMRAELYEIKLKKLVEELAEALSK